MIYLILLDDAKSDSLSLLRILMRLFLCEVFALATDRDTRKIINKCHAHSFEQSKLRLSQIVSE